MGLSVISRGTTEEKLRWIFELYDVDQNEKLTRDDICDVVSSIYAMMGNPTNPPIQNDTVEKHVDYIFNVSASDKVSQILYCRCDLWRITALILLLYIAL